MKFGVDVLDDKNNSLERFWWSWHDSFEEANKAALQLAITTQIKNRRFIVVYEEIDGNRSFILSAYEKGGSRIQVSNILYKF